MSFFRNLRSSITRGRSTSRDTTPIRTSRSGSVISSLHSGSSKRRDSIESRSDSLLNRSDTFILDHPNATPCHSNCSTLEKKSKKSKVLEKFSTFTKRKKNPASEKTTFEHHPSDNATNTYYKWQVEEGGNSLDYDCQNDPFNVLYQQQSTLKAMQNKAVLAEEKHSPAASTFDSSTYRKSKMPSELKKQLKTLKTPDFKNELKSKVNEVVDEDEEREREDQGEDYKKDRYKTITLNSFRRSFRDKFLQQQKEAAHNPAWFVEVEPPEPKKTQMPPRHDATKENRNDLLVFENDNFRPGSRSPIRDLHSRKEARNATRSPVKRNETFRVTHLSRFDQQALKTKPQEPTGSIHIEFKNSITPHVPGRVVPLGVAKPMPSQLSYNNYYRKLEPSTTSSHLHNNKINKGISTTRLNNHSPNRNPWPNSSSPARNIGSNPNPQGRFQTLVQIKSEKSQPPTTALTSNSRLSTRIQLVNNNANINANLDRKLNFATQSPSFGKRYHSSQLLNQSGCKPPSLKQTYFGETPHNAKISQIPSNLGSSTSGLRHSARQTAATNYGNYKYHTPALFASASSLTGSPASPTRTTTTTMAAAATAHTASSRTTPSHSISNIYASSSNNNNNLSYNKPYHQQPQTRFAVTGQRRARSPIKIPWR